MPVTINGTSGLVTATTFSGSSLSGINTGKVLQVVSATKTDTQSFNSTSFTDITGLSASITLSSSSNKVFIMANVYTSMGSTTQLINFVRDSTNIAQPSGSATNKATIFGYNQTTLNMHQQSMSFLDTPGDTNAHTYKLQLKCFNTNAPVYVNRYNSVNDYYAISTITLMEVAG